MVNQRDPAYMQAYAERLAALGLEDDGAFGPVRAQHFEIARATADKALDLEELTLSELIWRSPLAISARALMEAAARGHDTSRVLLPADFLRMYEDDRQELFRQLLRDRNIDQCRGCKALVAADEVKLVLVHESTISVVVASMGVEEYDRLEDTLGFAYLCPECRVPRESVSRTYRITRSSTAIGREFRLVYPAVVAEGFWAEVDGEFYRRLPGENREPAIVGAQPAMCTPELADELGLPPSLRIIYLTGRPSSVMMARGNYSLELLPSEVVAATAR